MLPGVTRVEQVQEADRLMGELQAERGVVQPLLNWGGTIDQIMIGSSCGQVHENMESQKGLIWSLLVFGNSKPI